jgi:hypothetical protein
MNIRILTFSKENSFGANLQCYALSKVLINMEHKVEIIDFRLPEKHSTILGEIGSYISHILFVQFRKKFLPKFTRHYKNRKDLVNNLPYADCYIVGSDQVWNTEITKELAINYFLDFVPNNKKRVAYAASFGNKQWKETKEDNLIKDALSKFNAIGVREESGLTILNSWFNIQGEIVLDPTLLLKNYDEILSDTNFEDGTLVSYRLVNDSLYPDQVLELAKRLNLKPVLLNHRRPHRGFTYRAFVGVKGWLKSISNSSFIITDSFHCMVFAIIFRKKFIVIPSHPLRTSRLTDLLEKLDIKDRFYTKLSDLQNTTKWMDPIDYTKIHERLENERNKSLSFLKNSLLK